MTVSTSSQKAARVTERKRVYNKPVRSALKTQVKAADSLIDSKEVENAEKAVNAAVSALDKAARKKVVHPNTAARQKSRLMSKLHKTKIAKASVETKEAKKVTKKSTKKQSPA